MVLRLKDPLEIAQIVKEHNAPLGLCDAIDVHRDTHGEVVSHEQIDSIGEQFLEQQGLVRKLLLESLTTDTDVLDAVEPTEDTEYMDCGEGEFPSYAVALRAAETADAAYYELYNMDVHRCVVRAFQGIGCKQTISDVGTELIENAQSFGDDPDGVLNCALYVLKTVAPCRHVDAWQNAVFRAEMWWTS